MISEIAKICKEDWNKLTREQQEEYIVLNNIKIGYTHDITETLRKGFGYLDNNGFWEYDCK